MYSVGTTIDGKTLCDHLDVEANDKAVQYLYEVAKDRKAPLTSNIFSEFHRIVQPAPVKVGV